MSINRLAASSAPSHGTPKLLSLPYDVLRRIYDYLVCGQSRCDIYPQIKGGDKVERGYYVAGPIPDKMKQQRMRQLDPDSYGEYRTSTPTLDLAFSCTQAKADMGPLWYGNVRFTFVRLDQMCAFFRAIGEQNTTAIWFVKFTWESMAYVVIPSVFEMMRMIKTASDRIAHHSNILIDLVGMIELPRLWASFHEDVRLLLATVQKAYQLTLLHYELLSHPQARRFATTYSRSHDGDGWTEEMRILGVSAL
jgi:hypothetical protein